VKSKLIALLGVISAVLYGLLQRSKAKSAEREADIAKASEKAGDKATDALIKGMDNENKPIVRNGRTIG